jgi:hypothetical protein
MLSRIKMFLLSKEGEPQYRCEDAAAVDRDGLRFGIADGATEGLDSKRWARYITKAWVSPSTARLEMSALPEYLSLLGERQGQHWAGRELPWYLEEKSREGAFAAFLGLDLHRSPTWDAIAIGDCCLFVERAGSLIESFPLTSPEQFGSRPVLLPSMVSRFPNYRHALRMKSGGLQAGDRLLLMSDAIACWYLRCRLEDFSVREDFNHALTKQKKGVLKEIIASERDNKQLRNDDVAIICIDIVAV